MCECLSYITNLHVIITRDKRNSDKERSESKKYDVKMLESITTSKLLTLTIITTRMHFDISFLFLSRRIQVLKSQDSYLTSGMSSVTAWVRRKIMMKIICIASRLESEENEDSSLCQHCVPRNVHHNTTCNLPKKPMTKDLD